MDVVDLDVDALFDDGDIDGQVNANSTLRQRDAAESQGEGEAEGEDDAEMLKRLKRLDGAAKAKKQQQHQERGPKFDAARVLSNRGLPALLPELMPQLEAGDGEGEAETLRRLLRGYELWAHRLYPRFAFDDAIERLERLGRQMPLRNAMKRLRRGLSLHGEGDDHDGDGDGDDEDRVTRRGDMEEEEEENEQEEEEEAQGEGEGEAATRKAFDSEFGDGEDDDNDEIAAMVREAERLAGIAD